jgi:mono/diheme cytochrome c family protein
MFDERQRGLRKTTDAARLLFKFLAVIGVAAVSGRIRAAEIRPIFSESCYPCHGPDENKRKANLRFDRKEGAFKVLKDGTFAIVPGNLVQSQLVHRVTATDPDEQMPPPASGRKISRPQIELLQRWISAGAKWEPHWSFVAPNRPPLPIVKNKDWPRNEIDTFILARLEREGLQPSPRARERTLLRRVSLDLTGLPATPGQLAAWSDHPDPLGAAVDELLDSPHFGERMASDWLDVARYADTHGFNNDASRSMWRWRDWVVAAFNQNLPYDRFITDQLAGDLETSPTLDQEIATGFNRNHGINSEGGIIDEEYRVSYVNDRVRTTSMAWMGLTMECARCHDHKFDPTTQHDYYKFFAFFNNIDETGQDGRVANAAPLIQAPTDEQQREIAALRLQIENARKTLRESLAKQKWRNVKYDKIFQTSVPASSVPASNQLVCLDLRSWTPSIKTVTNAAGGKQFQLEGNIAPAPGPLGEPALCFDGHSDLKTEDLPHHSGRGWVFDAWVRRDRNEQAPLFSTASFTVPESSDDYGRGVQIIVTASGAIEVRSAIRWPAYSANIVTRETLPLGEWQRVEVAWDGSTKSAGMRVFLNGRECFSEIIRDDLTSGVGLSGPAQIGASEEKGASRFAGALAGIEVWTDAVHLDELAAQWRREMLRFDARTAPAARHEDQIDRLHTAWLETKNVRFAHEVELERQTRSALLKLRAELPDTMVMRELPNRRSTHLLFRGQYDQPRDEVRPDVPEFLFPFSASAPRNRLGLAQWLTDPRNPLTARVVVNRFWQSIFGHGIVKSAGDFGYQGDYPVHPELLDWLATRFIDSGWNVKQIIRLMVTSATYAQTSDSSPELNERDPENLLLARGPRQRLTAEMLRDQALFVSGLFYDKLGGPPVFPYQPKNLYKGIVVAADYPGTTYTESQGKDLYRRSLYTFWKRTVPYPTLSIFDVPDREVCVVQRSKTDTPLQALALMNDPVQLEAARKLAERMLLEGGISPGERLDFAFELATSRKPRPNELESLSALLEKRLTAYHQDIAAAKAFISVGESKPNATLDPIDLAAYANVASLMLNLDETITRD